MPTGPVEKEPSAERGYSGFAVSEDHRRGRRARLRWRQEGQGKKTPLAGRYRGLGAKGESPRGQRGGPGGDQEAARWCQGAVPTPFTPVAGRWLQGPRERQRLGGEGFRMECGTGRTSTQTCPRRSADEVGGGIGQGRQDSRLAEGSATAGISASPTPLGGGTHVRLAVPQPAHEQGLREAVLDRRGVCLRGDDPPNGEAVDPCPIVFGRWLLLRCWMNSPSLSAPGSTEWHHVHGA